MTIFSKQIMDVFVGKDIWFNFVPQVLYLFYKNVIIYL